MKLQQPDDGFLINFSAEFLCWSLNKVLVRWRASIEGWSADRCLLPDPPAQATLCEMTEIRERTILNFTRCVPIAVRSLEFKQKDYKSRLKQFTELSLVN